MSVAQSVGIRGALPLPSLSFFSFSFVRWRFNPFLTLHFHMVRQQSGLVAIFFLNEVFVTGK